MLDDFDKILRRALQRFPNPAELESSLPVPASRSELLSRADDRYLSTLCRRVFRAGLKHSMVDARWPQFEAAFHNFDPMRVAAMGDEELESTMGCDGVIRHWGKIKSIRSNACMVVELSNQHGGFGAWLGAWPSDNIIGLWRELKSRGAQLGGMSGASFLRMSGVDTFLLTTDVASELIRQGVVGKPPSSQKELKQAQWAFNEWRQDCGRPLCQISRILSYTAV